MSKKTFSYARRPKHKTRHEHLATDLNSRIQVSAEVTRTGSAVEDGRKLRTLLLHNVRMTAPRTSELGDHIWIKLPQYSSVKPTRGDKVVFSAFVREYTKKYEGRDKTSADDIGLFDVKDLKVVGNWND